MEWSVTLLTFFKPTIHSTGMDACGYANEGRGGGGPRNQSSKCRCSRLINSPHPSPIRLIVMKPGPSMIHPCAQVLDLPP